MPECPAGVPPHSLQAELEAGLDGHPPHPPPWKLLRKIWCRLNPLTLVQPDTGFYCDAFYFSLGLPGESTSQCRRHKKCRFDPWIEMSPGRRKWLVAPVFLPGESHGHSSLAGNSPWSLRESDVTKHTLRLVTYTLLSSDHRHPQGRRVPLHLSLLPPSTSCSITTLLKSISSACPPKASHWTGQQLSLPLFHSHGASHLGGVPST